jgi:hypothetical protein
MFTIPVRNYPKKTHLIYITYIVQLMLFKEIIPALKPQICKMQSY